MTATTVVYRSNLVKSLFVAALIAVGLLAGFAEAVSADQKVSDQNSFVRACRRLGGVSSSVGPRKVNCYLSPDNDTTCDFNTVPAQCTNAQGSTFDYPGLTVLDGDFGGSNGSGSFGSAVTAPEQNGGVVQDSSNERGSDGTIAPKATNRSTVGG